MAVLGSEPNVIPDQVVAREEVEILHKEFRVLPPKERKVLELRFGLRQERKTQRGDREDARHLPELRLAHREARGN